LSFVPGLELARAYYEEVVSGIVGEVEHSAALLGWGSDVLGLDTERSTDHGWGPRLQVFVRGGADDLSTKVESELPSEFRGWPTRFGWDDHPLVVRVEVAALGDWFENWLGFDPRRGVDPIDWLVTPQQRLLEVTAGAVFHDGLDELKKLRRDLEWYPREIWLWLLACQWRRLDQEEPFVGRTAEVEDELGSRILATRLARDLMRLCFLLERRYVPYSKWLGTAFATLDAAADVKGPLEVALAATDFQNREDALVIALEAVARRHNELGLTDPVEPTVRLFHDRPFRVLASGRFVDACLAGVEDESLRSLPLVGSIDQISDSTDVLVHRPTFRRFLAIYDD
jgi:hypothetical protein